MNAFLSARCASIARAPLPVSVTRLLAHAWAEQLAAQGKLGVDGLINGYAATPSLPTESRQVKIANIADNQGAIGFVEITTTVAVICHLLKDQVLAALDAELEAKTDHSRALTPEARAAATEAARTDLLLAERHLASLVWQALDQGLPVQHAPDADPVAMLGIMPIPEPYRPPPEPQWPMVIERVGV